MKILHIINLFQMLQSIWIINITLENLALKETDPKTICL